LTLKIAQHSHGSSQAGKLPLVNDAVRDLVGCACAPHHFTEQLRALVSLLDVEGGREAPVNTE
jgi:hypothetical protein